MELYEIPMMIAGLMFSIVSMAVGTLTIVILVRSYWCEIAWRRYARKTVGLPMLRRRHLLANHVRLLIHGESNSQLVRAAHEQLGKTFGWMNGTQRAASTIDLDLIRTLIESANERARCPPSVPAPIETGQGLMWARGDKWRKLRAAFAPVLRGGDNMTRSVEEDAYAKLEVLIEHYLESKSHALIAIDDLIHRFTLDVLFAYFYGANDQVKFDNHSSLWVTHVNRAQASASQDLKLKISIVAPWSWTLLRLFDTLAGWLHLRDEARNYIAKLIVSQIKSRLMLKRQLQTCGETGETSDSNHQQNFLIDPLVDHHLADKLTLQECVSCLSSLVGTADTTTKSCIVNTLYLLATHEQQQNRLRESLARDGAACDYLSWVLNESLRLLPPVPFGVARTLERDTRLKNGHIVPAGTFVCIPTFALHRSEEHWGPDAAEFRPERWLKIDELHRYQFLPFGAGHRRCPGQDFALHQMNMLLASLLKRYKFEAKVKSDVQKFSSPFQHYSVPNSPTYLTIKRV